MPWIGLYEGEKKGAWQVPLQTDAECPTCGGRVRVWSEGVDGTASHFKHIDGMSGGNGGPGGGVQDCDSVAESDEHLKWKNLAAQRLATAFDVPDECVRVEMGLEAPVSAKERRIGDAVLVFPDRDEQLGRGVVVEVQHRNDNKDIEETTADYIKQDFSVVWTDESDFADDHCRLVEVDFRHRAREAAWPEHVPSEEAWANDPNEYHRIQSRWQRAWADGLSISGATATLPPDWLDDLARRFYEETPWDELFTAETPEDIIQDIDTSEIEFSGLEAPTTATFHLEKWLADSERVLVQGKNGKYDPNPDTIGTLSFKETRELGGWPKRFPGLKLDAWAGSDVSNSKNGFWTGWILAPANYEVESDEAGQSETTSANSDSPPLRKIPGSTTHRHTPHKPQNGQTHWKRYEGWDEKSASNGHVRRFDKTQYRWVELPIDSIPEQARRRRE